MAASAHLHATDLLASIAERGDVIAQAPDGRVFVLLELDGPAFAALCAAGAAQEDLEAEEDDDSQVEPSLIELHPLDRPVSTIRRTNLHNMKMEAGH